MYLPSGLWARGSAQTNSKTENEHLSKSDENDAHD
jgi:hypothetical protein